MPKEKFVNEEANSRYNKLQSLRCIFERGFMIEEKAWSAFFVNQIDTLGWHTFCHPRCEAVLPWVYEFYANAPFSDDDTVEVRGTIVDFSSKAINDLLELPTEAVTDYKEIKRTISPDDLAAVVCGTVPPEWTRKYKQGLTSTCLTREAKVWLLYINAGILPTKHLNNVSLDRLSIMYCIFKNIQVDVGKIIHESIKAKAKEEKAKYLWFPTLITELCRNAGVPIEEEEVVTKVGHHITETVVEINIKVPNEFVEKGDHERTIALGRYVRPQPSSPEPCGMVHTDASFIQAYQRMDHLYFDSRADYICGVLAKLMHKAKLSMPAPKYKCSGNFDSDGYLLDESGERIEVLSDGAEEFDDDDDDSDEGDD